MTDHRLKGLVFILDGLGDRPCGQLSGLTPLEHADTPFLDKLSQLGQSGLMDPLSPGLTVDTHTGVGILFGLPPYDAAKLCRGPIEAAGINLNLQVGDLLFRTNLAAVEKQGSHYRIIDRRAGRIKDGVNQLCDDLRDIDVGNGITASLFPATQHRCVLRFQGPQLSSQITDTDPGGNNVSRGILGCQANSTIDINAGNTAAAVNRFTELSHRILDRHPVNAARSNSGELPANGIIARGVGFYQEFSNLLTDLNLSAAVIAGESTILGLGNLFNFTTCTDPSFTALPDTDLFKKIRYAMAALESHDIVYVHLKGTDTTAHDRDPLAKSAFISRFDSVMSESDIENFVVGICADHSTDSVRGEHTGDPVPVIIYSPCGRKDPVERFNETDCIAGSLGRLTARQYLTSILDAMGCLSDCKPSDIKLYGSTDN